MGAGLVLAEVDDDPLGMAPAVGRGHGRERGAEVARHEGALHLELEAVPVLRTEGLEQDHGQLVGLIGAERHGRETRRLPPVAQIVGELDGVEREAVDGLRLEWSEVRDRVREVLVGELADVVEDRFERIDGIELVFVAAQVPDHRVQRPIDRRPQGRRRDDEPDVGGDERMVDGEAGEQVALLARDGRVGQHLVVEALVGVVRVDGMPVVAAVQHRRPEGEQHRRQRERQHESRDEQDPRGPAGRRLPVASWGAFGTVAQPRSSGSGCAAQRERGERREDGAIGAA